MARKSLTILQWNCRSIFRKLPEFKNYLNSLNHLPQIICLQETFLNLRYSPQIAGYKILRKDRCSYAAGAGGGICMFVRNDLSFTELNISHSALQGDEEIMGITVKGMNIINIYNRPSNNLSPVLLNLVSANETFVFCGDFNAHHPAWGSASVNTSGSHLMRFIDNGDHVLLNTSVPTHFTLSNQIQWSLSDLTIVSANIASKCNTKVTQDFLGSDHSVILTTIQGFEAPTKLQIPRWNFHRADWPAFTSECLHQITDQTISKNTVTGLLTKSPKPYWLWPQPPSLKQNRTEQIRYHGGINNARWQSVIESMHFNRMMRTRLV